MVNILDRQDLANSLVNKVRAFFLDRTSDVVKRGFYVYGHPGSGKTEFVTRVLRKAGFDVVKYDAGDIRNKNVIESITQNQMGDVNIMSLWKMKSKKIVIVMDEIDGMNNGDKGGITALIKLIRPKKTKKQKMDNNNFNPIVCIGNYHVDKKINDLMRVSETFEVKRPSDCQMAAIVRAILPRTNIDDVKRVVEYAQGDLRRLNTIVHIVSNGVTINSELFDKFLASKTCTDDAKNVVRRLMNERIDINQHSQVMNETDRTIVALLWHENVIDGLKKHDFPDSVKTYKQMLDYYCMGDFIDRVTFQKQIWAFNEMSSLIKTVKGNQLFHDNFVKKYKYDPSEVRFTKVLTKYSTEFNNATFIHSMCQRLGLDKKDLYTLFLTLRNSDCLKGDDLEAMMDHYDVSKLEIERMQRLLERNADTVE